MSRCSNLIEQYPLLYHKCKNYTGFEDNTVVRYNCTDKEIKKGDIVWENQLIKDLANSSRIGNIPSNSIKSTIGSICQSGYLIESIKRIQNIPMMIELQTRSATNKTLESEFKERDIDQIYFKKISNLISEINLNLSKLQVEAVQVIPKNYINNLKTYKARIRLPKNSKTESLKATRVCGIIDEYSFDGNMFSVFTIYNYYLKSDKDYKDFCNTAKIGEGHMVKTRCSKLIDRFNEGMKDDLIKKYGPLDSVDGVLVNKDSNLFIGYSHRGVQSFKIGDKIFDASWKGNHTDGEVEKMKFVDRGGKTIKTREDGIKAAQNFQDYVS